MRLEDLSTYWPFCLFVDLQRFPRYMYHVQRTRERLQRRLALNGRVPNRGEDPGKAC